MTSDRQAPACCPSKARRSALSHPIKAPPQPGSVRALLLLTIVLFLAGCAAEAPPRPPRIERPAAVRDLTVHQVGAAVELRFTLPADATDGESLTKPVEVEIFRSALPPERKGSAAAVGTGGVPWMVLQGRELTRQTVAGTVAYTDRLSPDFRPFIGRVFAYEVLSLTRGFRGRPILSEPSNQATLTLLDVPQPVVGLSIRPTQRALNLSWQAPAETLTGRPAGLVESYQVYRRETSAGNAGKPYKPIGVAHETSYADSDFEFGHLYSYRVRAVVSENGSTAESADSQPVEIMPKDIFPPAVPLGLTGLYTSRAVELIWTPNHEPDLAGYNVYRREAGQQAMRSNSDLVRSAFYQDTAVTPGHRYFYRVTAEDLSGNESAACPEVEVDVP